jgi:hypothetical protein
MKIFNDGNFLGYLIKEKDELKSKKSISPPGNIYLHTEYI